MFSPSGEVSVWGGVFISILILHIIRMIVQCNETGILRMGCHLDCPCQVFLQNLQGQTETELDQVEGHHCSHCSQKMLPHEHMRWGNHLVGGAGAGVGEGAAAGAGAAPPCFITR